MFRNKPSYAQLCSIGIQILELLITRFYPRAIVVLNELLDEQPPSKCGPTDNIVASNKPVCEMIDVVLAIVNTQLKHANLVKMWMTLRNLHSIIKFGVSFPEDIKEALKKIKLDVADCTKLISEYSAERANTLAQLRTYPHVEEYHKAIVEMDEKTRIALKKVVCNVRNNYSVLIDVATKNLNHMKTYINVFSML